MLAPDHWKWTGYEIKDFDMLDYARKCLRKFHLEPDYVHSNKSTTVGGWEDNRFEWLTAVDTGKFMTPGPALGQRSKSLHLLFKHKNLHITLILVGTPSSVMETYLRTGKLPNTEDDMDTQDDGE
jgi:hypothetical protein